MKQLSEKYNSGKSEELSVKDLAKLLKDRGINITTEQLRDWTGDIDADNNGYDTDEIEEVIDHFEQMATWKPKSNETEIPRTVFGFFKGDLPILVVIGVILYFGEREKAALTKKVTQSSFALALRMAVIKKKWKNLEEETRKSEETRATLEAKIEELNARPRSESDNDLLASLERQLKSVVEKQEEKDAELAKMRKETQEHMEKAHMSNAKLEAVQWMLKGAESFRGAGKGAYQKDGTTVGFGTEMPSTDIRKGYQMKKELFGFWEEGNMKFFEMGKLLASGTDGAYRCHDITTRQEHCVKRYSIANDRERASMLRDLQAKQKIGNHKHIVRFQHAVETEDKIYVMMELIPGKDILDYVKARQGRIPENETAVIFHQLCQALKFCHDNDIVHGDVKPENAMVSGTQAEPLVKLIDFGFASFLGTYEHSVEIRDRLAPPEAFEKDYKPTKEGDSFRLGGTLFIMLCGTYAFPAGDSLDKRKAGEVKKGRDCPNYDRLSEGAKDLIDKLHKDRISMEEAMSHSWVKEHVRMSEA